MGGIKIIPDISIEKVKTEKNAILILPGGEIWENKKLKQLLPIVNNYYNNKKPIAAICGATIFLAENGFLDSTFHTSNYNIC